MISWSQKPGDTEQTFFLLEVNTLLRRADLKREDVLLAELVLEGFTGIVKHVRDEAHSLNL